ncbi:MAG: MinD/ParA family protein [Porticoccaceae bacterium]|nr:MinD/ParA family protein [Porticoccaceae bacterium]
MANNSSVARAPQQKPVRVIAITSGKGGVGKTNISVNLAASFAKQGDNVLLMDADLGLANVDILFDLHPKYDLRHVIAGERTLDEVIVDAPMGLKVIPASSGVSSMADLSPAENAGLVRAFSELAFPVDTMIVDTAAGISDSVITFCKASQEVVVVVCDEPTSITDAYALIKVMSRDHGVKRFHILANMVNSNAHGEELFRKISRVTDHFLDIVAVHIGSIPMDDYLRKAVRHQMPVVEAFPRSPSAQAITRLTKAIDKWPVPELASGNMEFFIERVVGYPNEEYAA